MNRRMFLGSGLLAAAAARSVAASKISDVLLLERIGPTSSELYIANADGTGERPLLAEPGFDYHASFASSGDRLVFTSERRGRGQADLYTVGIDGHDLRVLTADSSVEDCGAVSPRGSAVAFVSTRGSHRANVWLLDPASGSGRNLTGSPPVQGDLEKPDGFFRPSWSPDGQWLAISSDRNTEWQGHSCLGVHGPSCSPGSDAGWEHIQHTSIYLMRPNGGDFRVIGARPGFSAGSPRWSPDGKRIVFYELAIEQTWNARISFLSAGAVSQIVSVDIASGERVEHTGGPGLKLFPQFLTSREIAYQIRGGENEGLHSTGERPAVTKVVRSPAWSPDGTHVVYEKTSHEALPQNTALYSWDPHFDYRSTDSFPRLSRRGKLVLTEQAQNASIATMNPDGSNRKRVFDAEGKGQAFAPCWSADGRWIAFGLGRWFENRATSTARIMRMHEDGSGLEALTEGQQNAGFPSYAPDGERIVYRVWDQANAGGLRILNLRDRSVKVLTNEFDNLPDWSPDGRRIVFTRRVVGNNFDIFTVKPDGSGLRRLTTSGANDAHGVWAADGRILWTSGAYGFRDEAALYDSNFQPYGQVWIMNADGSGQRALTDSLWEDGEPMLIPARFLSRGTG